MYLSIVDLNTSKPLCQVMLFKEHAHMIPQIGDTVHRADKGIQHVVKERHVYFDADGWSNEITLGIDYGVSNSDG